VEVTTVIAVGGPGTVMREISNSEVAEPGDLCLHHDTSVIAAICDWRTLWLRITGEPRWRGLRPTYDTWRPAC
jgi:hypothetical protein